MKIKKQDIIEFSKLNRSKLLLKEVSNLSIHSGIESDVDDRICGFYKDKNIYLRIAKTRAEQIGYVILNDLMDKADSIEHTNPINYTLDFTDDVSFYTNTYRENVPVPTYFEKIGHHDDNLRNKHYSTEIAYQKWKKRIKEIAGITGWTFIDWIDEKITEPIKLKNIIKK